MLTKDEVTFKAGDELENFVEIKSYSPNESVTVEFDNVFSFESGDSNLGWMLVVYDPVPVDGSNASVGCASDTDMSPGDSIEVTGECVEGVATFHVFVYDSSSDFASFMQNRTNCHTQTRGT